MKISRAGTLKFLSLGVADLGGCPTMKTLSPFYRAHIPRIVVLFLTVNLLLAAAHAGNIKTIASTVPSNGDVNPYGIAVVPATVGSLTQGNILITNFNNSTNLQGTGTTIV